MKQGFVTIPILVVALFASTLLASGGYTVYKINQLEKKNAEVTAQLQIVQQTASTSPQSELAEAASSLGVIATTTTGVATSSSALNPVTASKEPAQKQPVSVPVPAISNEPQTIATQQSVDLCNNIEGIQTVLPEGYVLKGGECEALPDVCPNITGIQAQAPAGMMIFKDYGCMTEREMDKISTAEREVRKAEERCDELKEAILDFNAEIAAIEMEYEEKIAAVQKNTMGGLASGMQGDVMRLQRERDAKVAPLEIERHVINSDYALTCN